MDVERSFSLYEYYWSRFRKTLLYGRIRASYGQCKIWRQNRLKWIEGKRKERT